MTRFLKSVFVHAFALLFAASTAFAQDRPAFSRAELDQMLAPVALYPDALLSQVLMASTYPLEVVQAARWSRANPGYTGQDAVNAVERMDWDPSVKSLVAFPQVLARMDEQIDWTQRLGEAFLAQQADVMDAVQGLRQRAAAAGYLDTDERLNIAERGGAYIIEPAQPEVVYVPYYDPTIVYGAWWWPAYPPLYWGPPVGYYVAPAYYPGWYWGSGIRISLGFFFGAFDWHRRHVHIAHAHRYHALGGRRIVATSGRQLWRHEHRHRRGVPYHYAGRQRDFTQARSRDADTRRDFLQRGDATSQQLSNGTRTGDSGGQTVWRRERDGQRTERNAAPAPALSTQDSSSTVQSGTRTGDGGRQTTRRQERDGQRTERNAAPAPALSTQDSSNSTVQSGTRSQRAAPGGTAAVAPQPRRLQRENEPRRLQQPQRERRPDADQRRFRQPEAAASRQSSGVRATGRPDPQVRARADRGAGADRAARNTQRMPRPAVSSPAPRAERSAPRAAERGRFQNRGRERQESPRSRDRRS